MPEELLKELDILALVVYAPRKETSESMWVHGLPRYFIFVCKPMQLRPDISLTVLYYPAILQHRI